MSKMLLLKYPSVFEWLKTLDLSECGEGFHLPGVLSLCPPALIARWKNIDLTFQKAFKFEKIFLDMNYENWSETQWAEFVNQYPSYFDWLRLYPDVQEFQSSHLFSLWTFFPSKFKEVWSLITMSYSDAIEVYNYLLIDSENWSVDSVNPYLDHFLSSGFSYTDYWKCIPLELKKKYNLKYLHYTNYR